jgi:plastocyanin
MKNKSVATVAILVLGTWMIACAGNTAVPAGSSQPSSASASTTGPDKGQSAANEIKIDNFSFSPAILTVPAGTTVKWTNHDDIPHNIVSSEQKFKSKPLDTDDSFSFTFSTPGTYQYFCGLHPKMVGKVIVEAAK